MFTLIPAIADPPRPSWWRRHVVSGTHREPDRETDPAGFFRTLAVCVLLSAPVWFGIALLLIRRFG
jgi:hypothetical protein